MGPLLKGTAFLTGAGSGIGRTTSLAFADHGITHLSLTDLDAASISTTSKLVKEAHPEIRILELPLDVTNEEEVKDAIAKTVAEFGRIDVAVNLAGIAHTGGTHVCETTTWKNLMNVNLDGLFLCHREQIRQMLKQEDRGHREGRGTIINVSSILGLVGGPSPAYVASKHAVIGLTKNDACTYAPYGIRINAICPGWTSTPMLDRLKVDHAAGLEAEVTKTPMKRMADPEEIADSIVFLASRMASFVCGSPLVVDGGYTAS